jgi:hypothetical protein
MPRRSCRRSRSKQRWVVGGFIVMVALAAESIGAGRLAREAAGGWVASWHAAKPATAPPVAAQSAAAAAPPSLCAAAAGIAAFTVIGTAGLAPAASIAGGCAAPTAEAAAEVVASGTHSLVLIASGALERLASDGRHIAAPPAPPLTADGARAGEPLSMTPTSIPLAPGAQPLVDLEPAVPALFDQLVGLTRPGAAEELGATPDLAPESTTAANLRFLEYLDGTARIPQKLP